MTKNKCGLPHHHGNDEEHIISRLPSGETIDETAQRSHKTENLLDPLPHGRMRHQYRRHYGHEQSRHLSPPAPAEGLRTDYIPPQRKRNVLQSRRYGNRE